MVIQRGGLPTDLLRGSLLLTLGAMLILKVANGNLLFYVKSDLLWGVLLAAVALLIGGLGHLLRWAVLRPPAAGWGATGGEAILLVPLVAGLLLPARPLDSAALEQRGLNTYSGLSRPADARLAALQADTSQWTLLDWSVALQQEVDPARLRGAPVSVVGFVYRADQPVNPAEFNLVRFVVTCCAADGAAVGLPVRTDRPVSLPPDTWLQITGTLDIVTAAGQEPHALIAATSIERVDIPRTPYLYP